MISFGPIPSRRLGKSLGINNIPAPKTCSYACVYCQVGPTRKHTITRQNFYKPSQIFGEVRQHLQKLDKKDLPDYLTFVPNGEPTLDKGLGEAIRMLKALDIPIAVITNASLFSEEGVIGDLCEADWVSVKMDAANEQTWKAINRPHKDLYWEQLQKGIEEFAARFRGTLVSETLLVDNINDDTETIRETAFRVANLNPAKAYLSIPTRPPAKSSVRAPSEQTITEAYQAFGEQGLDTELLLGFEGTDTGFTGNAEEDILNISAVHPIREDTMAELLRKNQAGFDLVESLISEGKIKTVEFKGKNFFLRNIRSSV